MKNYHWILLLCGVSLLLVPACSEAQTSNGSSTNQTSLNIPLTNDSLSLETQFFDQGNTLFDAGKYNESMSYYNQALSINPNDTDVLYQKGRALNNIGQYNNALNTYDKVLAIDPSYTDVFKSEGIVFDNLNQTSNALASYDKAIAINPNDTDSLLLKGKALETIGKYDEAISNYDNILQIDSSNTDALYQKGEALDKLGKKDEAITYYDKVLAIDPTNTAALNNKNLDQGKPALNAGGNAVDQRVLISVGIIVFVLAIIIIVDRVRAGKRRGSEISETDQYEEIETIDESIQPKKDDEWKGI